MQTCVQEQEWTALLCSGQLLGYTATFLPSTEACLAEDIPGSDKYLLLSRVYECFPGLSTQSQETVAAGDGGYPSIAAPLGERPDDRRRGHAMRRQARDETLE